MAAKNMRFSLSLFGERTWILSPRGEVGFCTQLPRHERLWTEYSNAASRQTPKRAGTEDLQAGNDINHINHLTRCRHRRNLLEESQRERSTAPLEVCPSVPAHQPDAASFMIFTIVSSTSCATSSSCGALNIARSVVGFKVARMVLPPSS